MRSLLSLWIGAILVVACDVDSPCDPGQVAVQGVCLTPVLDAGGTGSADAAAAADADAEDGGSDGTDAAVACTEKLEDVIGTKCKKQDDCSCAAPYCALQPGATEGFCTITDCEDEGKECPTGYYCFDLKKYAPVTGVPLFCLEETK